jgi:hypothetical protein
MSSMNVRELVIKSFARTTCCVELSALFAETRCSTRRSRSGGPWNDGSGDAGGEGEGDELLSDELITGHGWILLSSDRT